MIQATADELSANPNGTLSEIKGAKPRPAESGLERITHDAGKKVGSLARGIVDTTSNYVKSGREYVQANPVKGVAAAAAIGAVAGSLLTLVVRASSGRNR